MHWLLFLQQALIPLGLLIWLALAPRRSGLSFWVQVGSKGLVLLALSLTGPWLLVPWWVGYVYGGAWLLLAEDGHPDMPVPRHDNTHPSGNYLILLSSQADIVLAHFRRGSLQVRAGQQVVAGQLLAQAGNSGATDEPHLHIHAQRPGPSGFPMGGAPLPMRFGGRFLVRNDRVRIPVHPFDVPGSRLATLVAPAGQ